MNTHPFKQSRVVPPEDGGSLAQTSFSKAISVQVVCILAAFCPWECPCARVKDDCLSGHI